MILGTLGRNALKRLPYAGVPLSLPGIANASQTFQWVRPQDLRQQPDSRHVHAPAPDGQLVIVVQRQGRPDRASLARVSHIAYETTQGWR